MSTVADDDRAAHEDLLDACRELPGEPGFRAVDREALLALVGVEVDGREPRRSVRH